MSNKKRQRISLLQAQQYFGSAPSSDDDGRYIIGRVRAPDITQVMNMNLTKTQKSYIMLYYNENLKVTEIARMYGVNKSTVSRTISRARKNIGKAFCYAAS